MHVVVDLRARLIPGRRRCEVVRETIIGDHGGFHATALIRVREDGQLARQKNLTRHPLTTALNGLPHIHKILREHLLLTLLRCHCA